MTHGRFLELSTKGKLSVATIDYPFASRPVLVQTTLPKGFDLYHNGAVYKPNWLPIPVGERFVAVDEETNAKVEAKVTARYAPPYQQHLLRNHKNKSAYKDLLETVTHFVTVVSERKFACDCGWSGYENEKRSHQLIDESITSKNMVS